MLLRMLMMMKYTYAMHPSLHYYSPFLDLRVLGWSLREGRRRRRRRQTYTHTYLSVRRNKKPREHIGEGEREGKRERGREGEREREGGESAVRELTKYGLYELSDTFTSCST